MLANNGWPIWNRHTTPHHHLFHDDAGQRISAGLDVESSMAVSALYGEIGNRIDFDRHKKVRQRRAKPDEAKI